MGLLLNVLNRYCVQRGVRNRRTSGVNHVRAAVFADMNGLHDVIEEGFMGHKVDYTGDSAALYAVQPDRRGHHDGQFPCNFAQGWHGDTDLPLSRLLEIRAVGVAVSVKQAPARQIQQIAALHTIRLSPVVYNPLLFSDGNGAVAELWNHTQAANRVLIGQQLVGNTGGGEGCGGLQALLQHRMGADVVGCNSYAAANQGRCCGHCQNADQELLFDAPHDRLPP